MLTLEQQVEAKDLIRRCLMQVSAREERIIRLRYGLGGCGEHEEKEIAEEFGLSRGRVNQLAARAMRRMSKAALPPESVRPEPPAEPEGIRVLRRRLRLMRVLPGFDRVGNVVDGDKAVTLDAVRTVATVDEGMEFAERFFNSAPLKLGRKWKAWYVHEPSCDVRRDHGVVRLALKVTFVDARTFWQVRRHWGHGGSAVQAEARGLREFAS